MAYITTRTWNALTCTLEGTDIYLGLAAARDDLSLLKMDQRALRSFPIHEISATSGSNEKIPLRVYSFRDSSIVRVSPLAGLHPEEGFQRVRLDLDLSGLSTSTSAASDKNSASSVMAFVLIMGLDPQAEDAFYNHVVHDFLDRAWMTVPRLLREMGCATPDELAKGEASTCPTPSRP